MEPRRRGFLKDVTVDGQSKYSATDSAPDWWRMPNTSGMVLWLVNHGDWHLPYELRAIWYDEPGRWIRCGRRRPTAWLVGPVSEPGAWMARTHFATPQPPQLHRFRTSGLRRHHGAYHSVEARYPDEVSYTRLYSVSCVSATVSIGNTALTGTFWQPQRRRQKHGKNVGAGTLTGGVDRDSMSQVPTEESAVLHWSRVTSHSDFHQPERGQRQHRGQLHAVHGSLSVGCSDALRAVERQVCAVGV